MRSGRASSNLPGKNMLGTNLPGGDVAVKSEINVTPLVDVCLVLLIIFMVVTPLLQQGVDVSLPETRKPEKMPEGAKQVTIAIKANGEVFVGQDWVPDVSQLEAKMKEMYVQSPEKDVVLKADRRLKYKQVRRVMQVVNESGYTGLGLITTRRESGT